MRSAYILAALALLAIVVIAVVAARAGARYDNYLAGLWVGDPAFLERAGLSDFQLFVAPRPAGGGARRGYLVIADAAGAYLANTPLEIGGGMRTGSALAAAAAASHDSATADLTFTFTFTFAEGAGADSESISGAEALPPRLTAAVSMADGTLTLHDQKRVHAFLVKDVSGSAVAVATYTQ